MLGSIIFVLVIMTASHIPIYIIYYATFVSACDLQGNVKPMLNVKNAKIYKMRKMRSL